MEQIDAVCPLLAGQFNLVGIDNNHVVAAVCVRCKVGLVLSAQDNGYLCAQATKGLVCCVDNNPLLVSCLSIC